MTGRRAFQAPGGSSSIVFGDGHTEKERATADKKKLDDAADLQQQKQDAQSHSNGGGDRNQSNGNQTSNPNDEASKNKKSQMEESSDNTMHKPGQSSHYQGANQQQGGNQQQQGGNQHMSEAARNKARQGSSLTFGNDGSASDSAAHNKYGQTHRNYNLITGETQEESNASSKNNKKQDPNIESNSGDGKNEAGTNAGGHTSVKMHHPPGGKSSGPLW
ncbi:hypothetical protein RvY_17622 [Ramazzottius varieornatus]|uniref:Microtubule-associated protein Jupiter n=1 Tax=Ramazzottius varieornatus TaxID=947166 RepID=A0A1D1W8J4_RAMVA|nr:hypothetical protein RvY_17622 [Ramazzottius varieornatus]